MVCYTFDHRSGRKPDMGGQQPAAYPSKQYFFETDATKGSAFGMECRGRLLFILRRQMEGPL
jgi:hypothetical protein